jgi:hypothetical protein
MGMNILIQNSCVKSERGYFRLRDFLDKPFSVSQNSAPVVHNIFCKKMSKTGLCSVRIIGYEDVNISLIL